MFTNQSETYFKQVRYNSLPSRHLTLLISNAQVLPKIIFKNSDNNDDFIYIFKKEGVDFWKDYEKLKTNFSRWLKSVTVICLDDESLNLAMRISMGYLKSSKAPKLFFISYTELSHRELTESLAPLITFDTPNKIMTFLFKESLTEEFDNLRSYLSLSGEKFTCSDNFLGLQVRSARSRKFNLIQNKETSSELIDKLLFLASSTNFLHKAVYFILSPNAVYNQLLPTVGHGKIEEGDVKLAEEILRVAEQELAKYEKYEQELTKGSENVTFNYKDTIRELFENWNLDPSKHANWCALFTDLCVTKACKNLGLDKPIKGSPSALATRNQIRAINGWQDRSFASNVIFRPGAIVVWTRGSQAWMGHIGIIKSVDWSKKLIYTIEGNTQGGKLAARTRSLTDPSLLGAGLLIGKKEVNS